MLCSHWERHREKDLKKKKPRELDFVEGVNFFLNVEDKRKCISQKGSKSLLVSEGIEGSLL